MPPPLQIKVDQAGKPPGVPGRAREDLALGTAVQLAAVGGPFARYLWTLAFKPVDVVAGARSSAALSSGTTSTTLVQPIDKAGTYRVGISVDAGFGLGAREQDVAFVTFYAGPTLNPDPTLYPRRVPATGETTEHNAPDAIDPAGNVDGWAREEARWKAAQEAGAGGGSGVVPATPSSLAKRGTAGEGYFLFVAPTSTGIATVGVVRSDEFAQVLVAARSHFNPGNDLELLSINGADALHVGDPSILSIIRLLAANAVRVQTKRLSIGDPFGARYCQEYVPPSPHTLNGGALAVDHDVDGSNVALTLNASSTLSAPTNVQAGGKYTYSVTQSGGPWTLAWDAASYYFGATFNPELSAIAGATDVFHFIGDPFGGGLLCVGASKNVVSANTYETNPCVTFTVSFADWSALAPGVTTFDYVLPALPARARLFAVVVENWTAVDDPTHGTFVMELGHNPFANTIRASSNIAAGATGYPQSYIGSSPWDGAAGEVGFFGCYLGGERPRLVVTSSVDLNTATQGSMFVRLFYFFGG